MNLDDLAPGLVVMAGDWHRHMRWAVGIANRLPDLVPDEMPRVVVHAGDFGVSSGQSGQEFLSALSRALREVDGYVFFADGNHDEHPLLRKFGVGTPEGEPVEITKRIWWLPRGLRWSWWGNSWLALGGAVSVDRVFRKVGVDWWPEEEISDADAAAAAHGGTADVMVCHDRPACAPLALPPPPRSWRQGDLLRSDLHRQRLQAVVDHVKPRLLIHGHYHYEDDTVVRVPWGELRVTGLDCDGGRGANVRVLNTRTLAWVRPGKAAA
ncbi:metallophosphoesterase [Amycolatopsis kentuckyensis]|uniref:metallophosphoesterase n=1 Tax=Amycolatopsis kentuckyensis TaxID=218823 RepID=UPI0035645F7D